MEKTNGNVQLGRRIRLVRDLSGLTQAELAEIIDVSIQYLSDLERGLVGASTRTICRICEATNCSADYVLLGRKDCTSVDRLQNCLDRIRFLPSEQLDLLEQNINLFFKTLSFSCREPE